MSVDYLFISCHYADGEALLQLSRALAERGVSTRSSNGTGPAVLTQVPVMAVCLGPHGLDQRQKQEIGRALARQAETQADQTGHLFPIIPILLPGAELAPAFLFRHAWLDLRHNLTDPIVLDKLAEVIKQGKAPARPIATIVNFCPYRGLQAFGEEDAAFFFGQEATTERLLAEVSHHNAIVLVGPVGSGKSSVINAGLLPLLRQGYLPATSQLHRPRSKWEVLFFTPGHQPFHRLAAALNRLLEPDLSEADRLIETHRLGDQLAQGEVRLEQIVEHALAQNSQIDRLLLVSDQFEELITLTPAPQQRTFIEALLRSLQQPKLSLLLALRADFYGAASRLSPELSQYLEHRVINLGPLTREELERVMVKPARPVTLAFEPGLTERILNDVEQIQPQLPLLEFTLAELWRHHQGGLLKHAVYDQIGQVKGAIAYRAERLWQSFSARQQLTARRLLTRLIRLTDDGQPICQPVSLAQLATALEAWENEHVRTIIEMFAEMQLLTLRRDETTGEPVVEIAHEVLAQYWPRWQHWLNEEREFLLWRQRLQGTMAGWERAAPQQAKLLRGVALFEAERWLAQRHDRINSEGRVYIWQSLARWNWERDLRWLIGLGGAVALILVFVITLTQQTSTFATLRQERNGAWQAQIEAEEHRREAEKAQAAAEAALRATEQQHLITLARFLILQAQTELADRLDRGLLLVIESLRRLPSAEAERLLQQGLPRLPQPIATIEQKIEASALIFSPDGQWLITAGKSGIPRVWHTITGRAVTLPGEDQGFPISASIQLSANATQAVDDQAAVVAFSPDQRWLAIGGWDSVVRVWSVETSQQVAHLTQDEAITALAFSPDLRDGAGSQWLAVGSWDGSVRVWPLILDWMTESDGELIKPPRPILRRQGGMFLKAHKDVVLALTFSPDGHSLASTSADNTTKLWDVAGLFEQYRPLPPFYSINEKTWELAHFNHQSAVWSAAFSPDGRWLATGSSDRSVRLWDTLAGSVTSQAVVRLPHPDDVKIVAFSPNGHWLVTVSADNVARVWHTLSSVAPIRTTRQPMAKMVHRGQIYNVVFSPNSRWLATTSADRTARIWEVATGREVAQVAHDDAVTAVAFSLAPPRRGDQLWLATTSRDGLIRVWEAAPNQEVSPLEPPAALINQACTRLIRNLTRQEWQQYLGNEPYRPTCPNLPVPED